MRMLATFPVLCLAITGCQKGSGSAATSPVPAQAGSYPMCGGQQLPAGSPPPRSGPVTVQLAPAFLDQMSACRPEQAAPADLIAKAGAGAINAKGDCEFAAIGVSCHYHAGSEFITSSTKQQTPGQGELHCIFPSADPKSPSVYGGHVVCSGAGAPAADAPHGHEVRAGAACSAEILSRVSSCQASRCCDDGTLTTPIADLVRDGRNDVRPDFRICSEAISIDCALLAPLTPREANSPALGGVGAPVFTGGRAP